MDILNNREIAITLWLLAILVYIFSSSRMTEFRGAFKNLLSAFLVKQIIFVLGLMIAYMGILLEYITLTCQRIVCIL